MGAGAIVVFLVVVVLGGAIAWQAHWRSSAREAWKAFARENDLAFDDPGWFGEFQMAGEYRGVSCEVSTESRGSGKNQTTYTVYAVPLPGGFPVDLTVFDEHFFSGLVETFGGQDVEVGDAKIDDALVFRTDYPDDVRQLFNRPGVVEAFRKLVDSSHSVKIEAGVASLEHTNIQNDRQDLAVTLGLLAEFYQSIDEAFVDADSDESETQQRDESMSEEMDEVATSW